MSQLKEYIGNKILSGESKEKIEADLLKAEVAGGAAGAASGAPSSSSSSTY